MNRGALRECHVEEHKNNGVCYRCESGYGHSPRVQFYDQETGDYVSGEGDVCTARWATTGKYHIEGEICGDQGTERIGDFLLCEYHRDRMLDWRFKKSRQDMLNLHAEQMQLDKERVREAEAHLRSRCIVYYVQRDSDGLIKIGSTTSPRARWSKLKSDYGPLRILATRGGTLQHEREAQDKFDALLAETREWFRPEVKLLRHILRLRTQYEVHAETRFPVVEVAEIRAMIRAVVKNPETAKLTTA